MPEPSDRPEPSDPTEHDPTELDGDFDEELESTIIEPSHRGGFEDFGGASGGLIERTFRERIVLVAVSTPPHDDEATESSLDELAQLVDTAGADEVARVVQRRNGIEPKMFIGKGKAEELRENENLRKAYLGR